MKKLLYFPIVHNRADMGSAEDYLSLEGERKYGKDKWLNHIQQVEKSWNKIETEILKKIDDINKVKIYQDGLPLNGEIGMKIIKDVADKGSKNYQIINNLINLGAQLEIAENKELLIKEYNLTKNIINADTLETKLRTSLLYKETCDDLLIERDKYIANQINTTLNDGETGIAFFGAIHSIKDKLDKNIKIITIQMFKDEISLNLITQIL